MVALYVVRTWEILLKRGHKGNEVGQKIPACGSDRFVPMHRDAVKKPFCRLDFLLFDQAKVVALRGLSRLTLIKTQPSHILTALRRFILVPQNELC
jgi:hypothetical protein